MAVGSVKPCRAVRSRMEWSVRLRFHPGCMPACRARSRGAAALLHPGTAMAQRQTLPVRPVRGTVALPRLTQPTSAGRPGTLRAIEAALKGDRLVFAVAQRDNTDEPTPDILYNF